MMISVVTVDAKLPALAKAAGSPGSAAAAAAATTATTAASATPATATTVASAAATATGHLHAALGARGIFLVEYVERRQADVSDFFHAKRQLMIKFRGSGTSLHPPSARRLQMHRRPSQNSSRRPLTPGRISSLSSWSKCLSPVASSQPPYLKMVRLQRPNCTPGKWTMQGGYRRRPSHWSLRYRIWFILMNEIATFYSPAIHDCRLLRTTSTGTSVCRYATWRLPLCSF